MNVFQRDLNIPTPGRGFVDISCFIEKLLVESKIAVGLCHIFCMHTSASLTITENADPSVHVDLLHFMKELVPDDCGRVMPYFLYAYQRFAYDYGEC